MNESQFIEDNQAQWQALEDLLSDRDRDPDQLYELFIKVSSDLSYARTFYPNRTVRLYLNSLTQRVLDLIQSRKTKFSISTIKQFYKYTLPRELWSSRKALIVSLSVFIIALTIGILSSAYNPVFAEIILGDDYIEMTNQNINEGDPMAVYKKMGQVEMFWGITINNIRVAFLAFVMGLFGTIGTIMVLLSNGIMVGAFQYFFYQKGLFLTSFLTIWIHGTIEISAIIIAGAAGIVLGDGLLHPKTHSRTISLQLASKRAIRILLSTIPLFIIAGFLEAYVTRLTELSPFFKIAIIVCSLLFILFHFWIYPFIRSRQYQSPLADNDLVHSDLNEAYSFHPRYLSFSQICEQAFAQFRISVGYLFFRGILPVLALTTAAYWVWAKYYEIVQSSTYIEGVDRLLFNFHTGGYFLFVVYWITAVFFITILYNNYKGFSGTSLSLRIFIKKYSLKIALITLPYLFVFYFYSLGIFLIFFVFIPFHALFIFLINSVDHGMSLKNAILNSYAHAYQHYTQYAGVILTGIILTFLLFLAVGTLTSLLYNNFLSWHHFFPGTLDNVTYFDSIFRILCWGFSLTFFNHLITSQYHSIISKEESRDLLLQVEEFGNQKRQS